ncbi:MAG: hypothetical protein IPN75_09430 [Dechloromonas sp.]|uniref:Secreted protein n=1 Tax=Candidatus Dechloromonas phosphorivorans TaxID=2899244 RepID=A0A9D7LUK0_9RHOO|nr:hypothetical protein [Candidatus Dechloromonas phosphorivorans]
MFTPVFTGSRNLHLIVVAALAALSSFSVVASEPVADEAPVAAEVVAPSTDSNIVVTPIPMPASVIELATTAKPVVKLRSAKGIEAGQEQAATENDAIPHGTASNGPVGTQTKEW